MRKSVLSLAASLLMLAPSIALADATGTALGVDPDAEAKRGKDAQVLVVGADIFIGDIVRTGPSGQVQIKFSDNTELVVGPRSALTIEDYLLREDGSAGKLAVNTLAGTFRFVTGGAPKDRYLIKTPTGTIGVRGTAFDWSNGEWGTKAMLYHGAIEVCTTGGTCVLLEDVCNVAEYDSNTARVIGHFDTITGPNRNAFRGLFRYAVNQRPLLREFRINGVERCVNRPTTSSAPGSLSTPGSGGGGPRPTPTPSVDPDPTPETPSDDNPPPTGSNGGGGNGGSSGGGSPGRGDGGHDDDEGGGNDDDDYRGNDGGGPFGGKGRSLSLAR